MGFALVWSMFVPMRLQRKLRDCARTGMGLEPSEVTKQFSKATLLTMLDYFGFGYLLKYEPPEAAVDETPA